jgi:hypothetical protein
MKNFLAQQMRLYGVQVKQLLSFHFLFSIPTKYESHVLIVALLKHFAALCNAHRPCLPLIIRIIVTKSS